MKILIVEDEALYADQLEMLCEQLGYEVVGSCEDAFSALDVFHREHPDLLLLDVNLQGDTDGIQLAERIGKQQTTPFIFITSREDDDTFQRAQATLPAAFLLKPFNTLQLQRSIELAVGKLQKKETEAASHSFEEEDLLLSDSFFIKVRGKLEKVRLEEIVFLAAEGRYAMIHTSNKRKFAVRIPLSELEQKLPVRQFLRTHRSYLVNLPWLESVDVAEMTLNVNGQEVPLSKGYKEDVLNHLQQL